MKPETPTSNNNDVDRLRAIMKRRWRGGAIAFAIPLVIAGGMAVFLPGLYQSHAAVMVEPSAQMQAMGENEADLSARIDQMTRDNLAGPRLGDLAHQAGLKGDVRPDIDIETQRAPVGAGGQVSVAISVTVRGRDPEKAAALANLLARYYVDAEHDKLDADMKGEQVALDDLKKQLAQEETRIREFDDQHLSELPEQVELHIASITTLNDQLAGVRVAKAKVMDAIKGLSSRREPSAQVSAAGVVNPEAAPARDPELVALQGQLRDLRSRYTVEHPEVQRVMREIAAFDARSRSANHPRPAASAGAVSPADRARADWEDNVSSRTRLEKQLADLSAQEKEISDKITAAQQAAMNGPKRGQERAAVISQVEASRESYAALLKRYQEMAFANGAMSARNPFRLAESATVARQTFAPNRARIAGIGLLFALFLAGGVIRITELVDRTFHSTRELRAFTRLPVLGTIPSIHTENDFRVHRWKVAGSTLIGTLSVFGLLAVTWFYTHANEGLVRMLLRKGN